jgi:hypothetical protein
VTAHFVELTQRTRRRLDVVDDCFLRIKEAKPTPAPKEKRPRAAPDRARQGSLF